MTCAVARTASLRLTGVSGNQSVSFGSLPSAGSAIVVKSAVWCGNGPPAGTCSDNQGNTYTLVASKTDNGLAREYAFLAENIGAPSGTFTVTMQSFNTGSWGHIAIAEVAGADTASAFDVSASNGAASSTNPATCSSGTTAATAVADSVAFATMLIDGGTNPTGMALPSGYTNVYDEENGASYLPSRTDYKILSATGTQSASWGSSVNPAGGSGRWSGLIVVIKGTAGGGGGGVTVGSDAGSRRNRPGRGPYSAGRYFRPVNWLESFMLGAQVYAVTVAEAAAASDTVVAQLSAGVTLTESGSAADALSTVATFLRSVAETAAATDSVSNAATLPASLSESGSAIDSIGALGTFGAAITESGSASDTVTTGAAGYSVAIAEAASAADAISNVLTAGAVLTETAAASDVVSSLAVLLASLAEAGSASDVYSTAGAIYSVDFAEAATALDAIAAQLEAAGVIVEAGSASDGVSSLVQFGAAVAEAVAALDVVANTGIFGVTIAEVGAATDVVSAPSGFGGVPPSRTIYVRLGNRVIFVR